VVVVIVEAFEKLVVGVIIKLFEPSVKVIELHIKEELEEPPILLELIILLLFIEVLEIIILGLEINLIKKKLSNYII
jgi:hypothetical protein